MLALIYLILAVCLGDHLCRRFYRFVYVPHRWAAAFLVGLLLSSWFTYLAAWAFSATNQPLVGADILFFAVAVPALFVLERKSRQSSNKEPVWIARRAPGSERWDWVTLAIYGVFACWMMFSTLNFKSPYLQIANNEFSDFGPNTAIARSFSVGHNFPTQYPHFSGEPIRYHFLFYFQAGNLEFLGLNLAWSLNILSVLSLLSMLALVMALGQLLFQSRTVGRLGSALFFFHGTLNVIPFLQSQHSLSGALQSIWKLRDFLPSGYPYRGETWGIWSQVVFLNQRHLASGIGLLLIVLIFLLDQYYERLAPRQTAPVPSADDPATELPIAEPIAPPVAVSEAPRRTVRDFLMANGSFIFSGFLLGALPFWNAFVFTSAIAVLLVLFLLFPARLSMLLMAVTAGVVALPQVYYLRSGGANSTTPRLLHWGYVIDNPTIANVIHYLGWTFGAKWVLIALALVLVSWFHRRLFIAICSLFLLTFFFQFSIEALANHKFLTLWLIIANLFVAYALWSLWRTRLRGFKILARLAAVALATPIVVGGAIDFFPIHNSYYVELNYTKDPLVDWLRVNTNPHDVFLTDRFVNHQILLAGRRVFYGWPSFAWSSGYDTTKRDMVYKDLFENRDPRHVFSLLHDNKIAYVAFDNGVRHGEFIKRPNEQLYAKNFPKVFEDRENKYASLIIYKIPDKAPAQFRFVQETGGLSAFVGGKGIGNGEFDFPRGLALDRAGNILVADTNNARLQKFSPTGAFINIIGTMGSGPGDFNAPDGIAVDGSGNIYVADPGNQRVQKLAPNGGFLAEWQGPPPGFYGPRDIAIGPANSIYVVDQGRGRIVRLNADGGVMATWGSTGNGDGQFHEPTGVAVDAENGRVYVADPRNQRIEVFDLDGKFLVKWKVNEWRPNAWIFQHLIVDPKQKRLYASSLATDEVLVFDLEGTKIGSLKPRPPQKLEGASAMALRDGKLYVLCSFANQVRLIEVGKTP
ncbi:MAG: hypothetical protein QOG67_3563 [Verrucomicrobiota bacterium]|jgi:DNA-binding beta-propeller fold protein YncE